MTFEGVTGFYPLSPLQEGLLFHSLAAPRSGMYFNQCQFTMRGQLNVDAFRRAWEEATKQHDILRTFFVWEGLKSPVQVVDRAVTLPFDLHDWQGEDPAAQNTRLDSLLGRLREEGFPLNQAPLMRLDVARTAADTHELIWSFHHLLLDGWSMFLVLQEVFATYEASLVGQERRALPPRPYRDFIAHLKRQNLAPAEAYWREALHGFTPPAPLIPDRGTPHHQLAADETDTEEALLSDVATTAIQAVARAHHVTLNTVVQLAWGLLLGRYGDTQDIVFGTVIAGRPPDLNGFEKMVGLFINTLPVRVRVSAGDRVLDALSRLQRQQVESRQYEFSPLALVQQWSGVPGDRPLFETLLMFENYRKELSIEEMVTSLQIENIRWFERTNYPLTLIAIPGTALVLRLLYSRRFDRNFVRRMLQHLRHLLEGMAEDPQRLLNDLPMLSTAERQLLVAWNDTATDYPRDRCIHELFEAQSLKTPDAVAVVDGDRQLTYANLNARANQVAHYLVSLGVGPEVPVGICLERSLELVVGVLGILKAGAAYVPLDPSHPAERLAFMLSDTRATVLITVQERLGHLPPFTGRIVCLDRDTADIGMHHDTDVPCRATAEATAYVIYTSGSTGTPKGVMAQHRGITRLVCNTNYVQLGPGDCVAHASNPSFDAATFEIWGALANGARLAIIPRDVALDPPRLADELQRRGVSTLFLTTGLFNEVVRARPSAFAGLKHVLFGGQAVDPHWVREALRAGGPERLLHVYGPTETTTFATWYLVEAVAPGERTIPIGRPISNTRVSVLDRSGQPVPVGVTGEVFVGGDGVARGYLNRPELTAEAFCIDPFSVEPGAKIYRTGDLARYLPDGNIEFLGRRDDQVKIRGFRVEPGEIEAALNEHPAVGQAVVLAREDSPGDKRLVAYVVPTDASVSDIEPLRTFLRERLPEYMRPSAYVWVERLPLTPNGKIDRRALPAPDAVARAKGAGLVWPANPTEVLLAQIWEELLDVRPIGVTDNFFELGGHSLLAVRMMHEIERTCGRRLPLLTLFQDATIRHIGRTLLERVVESPAAPMTAINADGSRRPFFFLHGDFNGGGFYSVALARHLGPDQPFYAIHPHGLDGRAMRLSIEEMAADHLATLRAVQPRGPYLLGGHCNGGLIALEMARRLQGDGERVDLVAVLDAWVQVPGIHPASGDEGPAQRPAATPLGAAYWQAICAYVPQRFHGPVALFYPGSQEDTALELAWHSVAEEVEVHRIPGNHLNFITRGAHVLGAHLRSCLEAAQQR